MGKKKRKTEPEDELKYYIKQDDVAGGPFTLSELKEYPILEDTLITTDTLDDWYEACCFECLDDLFNARKGFRISTDGTIIRIENGTTV